MKSLLCAVAFLTRLPVPNWVHTEEAALHRSAAWFPFIGLLLGSVYAAAAYLLRYALPPGVIAALLLILDALLTRALHLDGLADMADGFGGGRSREDVLRIMRDHAIGSYGGAALVLTLLLKFACLSQLLTLPRGLWFLLIAPALSRWSLVLLSLLEPYARTTATGSGALAMSVTRSHLAFATLTCVAVVFLFEWRRSLFCWLTVVALTAVMARISRRRIGGITGDVLGSNVVLTEALQLIVALL